ncbi:MAG: 23S rRNA (adenine(2503)-C(2))-methyltransferase RlmN [Lachnospirales bacterium]
MDKIDIRALSYVELEKLIVNIEEKSFRAKQIYEWLHKKLVDDFSLMTNISKTTIEKLSEIAYIPKVTISEKFVSEDGTTKYLFKVKGGIIESVLMKYTSSVSVCVSTQMGCRMGCTFCASTIGGLERNLSVGEMLGQVYEIQKDIEDRVSHVVLMGSGEPLENYDNTLGFIDALVSDKGLDLSARHITLSTCGLIEKINDLAKKKLQINLAVSLHAPNNELRQQIMPIAFKYDYDELIKACKDYGDTTKRRVTYEYALIKGVNDSTRHANELGKKLRGSLAHVNLIPVNDVKERNYTKSSKETISDFSNILKSLKVETTIRRENGSDINASCGQLRNERSKENL